jgi:hypothetical protein
VTLVRIIPTNVTLASRPTTPKPRAPSFLANGRGWRSLAAGTERRGWRSLAAGAERHPAYPTRSATAAPSYA